MVPEPYYSQNAIVTMSTFIVQFHCGSEKKARMDSFKEEELQLN